MLLTWLGCASPTFATQAAATVDDQAAVMAPDARVRGVSSRIVAIISTATAQSDTFRGLVNEIGHTDGMVYVAEGDCGRGVRACLLHTMTVMGPYRVVRILVDPSAVDCDLMASIGHELQHAVEVLSHRSVRSASEMKLLYKRICDMCGPSIETNAAVRTGNAVHDELRKNGADSCLSPNAMSRPRRR
jgi:hypothetical protein